MVCFEIYVHSLGVLCPADSKGINVPSGCKCNAGFAGNVVASSIAPYFISSCIFTPCPNSSNGFSVHSGCHCNAGFNGTVVASEIYPFYNYSCNAVKCPLNSFGANLPSGCFCNAGYSGLLVATENSPLFYTGPCLAVACPADSSGLNIPNGCVCNSNQLFQGTIVAIRMAPFYSGTCVQCTPVPSGINVKSTDGLYTYLKWESNANAGFALPLSCAISIDYLLVAGGGAGGASTGTISSNYIV